ncbi:MAG: hypothetical protein Q4Q03_07380, partial [Bowdeniella nasicola]|nr:hypothetical protein [Bowdeniella nasicola]
RAYVSDLTGENYRVVTRNQLEYRRGAEELAAVIRLAEAPSFADQSGHDGAALFAALAALADAGERRL